jgi:hypothetical protein
MAITILTAVRQIKADVAQLFCHRHILDLCQSLGMSWRKRILDPATTIHLFLLQVLNTNAPCSQVPRLGNIDCTAEAYCQARKRLPLNLLQLLLRKLCQHLSRRQLDDGRWHGHRTFLIDGSGISMPDTPALKKAFGHPNGQKSGCGFPVLHFLGLFHAASGILLDLVTAPLHTHDLSNVSAIHPQLGSGDILVGDRAFCSFAHLVLLARRGVFGLFRVHQRQIVNFRSHRPFKTHRSARMRQKGLPTSRWLARLGRYDQLVEYRKPPERPPWLTEKAYKALPMTIVVREIRFRLAKGSSRSRQITVATTLIDKDRYPKEDLMALYRQRWQVETNFRHLKQTLKMDVLRCKTVAGVSRELLIYALVYNLVRMAMWEAAQIQQVPVERISFVDAVRWLDAAINRPILFRLRVVPARPGRQEPRAVKRRRTNYARLTIPRKPRHKPLSSNNNAA